MKVMKDRIIIALVIYILCLLLFGKCWYGKRAEFIDRNDTIFISDTILKVDTMRIVEPIPNIVEVLRIDTVFSKENDTIPLITENKTYIDTLCVQKDTAIVTNTIQGINANLISTEVLLKRQEITNTITIEKIIKEKPSKWNLSPMAGFGYGLFNKNADIFLGVGISYTF